MRRVLDTQAAPMADPMLLDLYNCLPEVRITHFPLEVVDEIGFAAAFTHLRIPDPCRDGAAF